MDQSQREFSRLHSEDIPVSPNDARILLLFFIFIVRSWEVGVVEAHAKWSPTFMSLLTTVLQ